MRICIFTWSRAPATKPVNALFQTSSSYAPYFDLDKYQNSFSQENFSKIKELIIKYSELL